MIAIGRQNGGMPRIAVALLRRQGTPLQSCSALWMGVATVSERRVLEGMCGWETSCGVQRKARDGLR
jgi:hypothetical protein